MDPLVECMIGECEKFPDRVMVLNENGILVQYAVCAEHDRLARAGAWLPAARAEARGLLGLQIT